MKDEPNPASYVAPLPPPPPATQEDPKSVTAFDEAVITGKLKPFLELSRSFAGASVVEIVRRTGSLMSGDRQ